MKPFYIIALLYLLLAIITSPLHGAIPPSRVAPSSCKSCITRKYYESESLEPYRAFNFDDESVIQFVKLIDPFDDSNLCIEPRVILRLIHRDGSVEHNTVDFPIPESNFCPAKNGRYPLELHRILPDKILIIYVNSTNISDAPSYFGLLVNKSGKVIRFVFLQKKK